MKVSRKQVYWGLGISAGLVAFGFLIHKNNQHVQGLGKEAPGKIDDWLLPITTKKFSSPFGYRTNPITKKQQFHNGIDLPTPLNTAIKNPFNGEVVNSYFNSAGGNQLIIKHDNGFTSGYAHLTKAMFKKGDKVKKGQIIAMSGNTGMSTGPHLHFTLKDKAGNWVDARKIIYGNVA